MMQGRQDEELRARVFISCGQNKDSKEPELACEIKSRLADLGFDPYVAVGEQSLRGLKENLFQQLERSEYLVFVDFKRERLDDAELHRGSLFSHQELAVASYLEIDVLAFQEQGVKKNDGILGFIQGNAIPFCGREKLPDLITEHVTQRVMDGKWVPGWRNELSLERKRQQSVDVNTANQKLHRYFHIDVCNRHHRKTAMNCCAYLERAVLLDPQTEIPFKIFELKWEAYGLPNAHIPAATSRSFDTFCIQHDQPNQLKFYAFCDASYVLPQIALAGRYELTYLVVADNFPPARRSFILTLNGSHQTTILEP